MNNKKSGIGSLSDFISSPKGQRFFNFAYSIGAAVVIWGALFKILHLPGGNLLLSIGMGTEVLMFILTAFDYSASMSAASPVPSSTAAPIAPSASRAGAVPAITADFCGVSEDYADKIKSIVAEMEQLKQNTARLNEATESLLESYKSIASRSGAVNAVYEIHMKDMVNAGTRYSEEADRMVRSMRQLGAIYDGMLHAMQVDSRMDKDTQK